MKSGLLALALALGLLGLPAAPAAFASEVGTSTTVDAIIVVGESDLSALLDSGILGEHSFVSAAEVGLDPAELAGALRFGEDALLTPEQLGLDNPAWGFIGPGFSPFFAGFRTIGVPIIVPRVVSVPVTVPVVAFRPLVFRPFPPLPRFPITFVGRVIIVPGF